MGRYDDIINSEFDRAPRDPFGPTQPRKDRPWFDLADVAWAVPRGVVGALKGAYNLVDTLAVDALPDWEKNPLGESESVVGGWVEGAAHFTAGFLPFGGVGKGLGLAGRLIKGASAGAKIGRVALASGAAGFTVFEGHEARLSDLVERSPALSNPLTQFLASNGDDPELLGRLKNAIEQAGLGAATEGILMGAKAVLKGRQAKLDVLSKGGTEEAANEAAGKAAAEVATPEEVIAAARKDQGLVPGAPGDMSKELPPRFSAGPAERAAQEAEGNAFKQLAAETYPDLPIEEAQRKLLRDNPTLDRRVAEKLAEGQVERRGAAKTIDQEVAATKVVTWNDLTPEQQNQWIAKHGSANAPASNGEVADFLGIPRTPFKPRTPFEAEVAAKAARAKQMEVDLAKATGESPKARGERMRAEGKTEAEIANAHLKAMEKDIAAGVMPKSADGKRIQTLRRLGLDEAKINKFRAAFEEKKAAVEAAGPMSRNPRDLSAAERARIGLLESDLPMERYRTPDSAYALHRTVEDFFREEMKADFKNLAPTTLQEMADAAAVKTSEMLGFKDPRAYMAALEVRAGRTLNSAQELIPLMQSDRALAEISVRRLENIDSALAKVDSGAGGPHSADELLVDYIESTQHVAAMKATLKGHSKAASNLFASFKNAPKAIEAEIPQELLYLAKDPVRLKQVLSEAGGADHVRGLIEKHREAIKRAGAEGKDAAVMKLMEGTLGTKLLRMTTEFFMGATLSSPQTWVINGNSGAMAPIFLPLERAFGSYMVRLSNGKLAPAADLALQEPIVRESISQITAIRRSFVDSFRMFGDSGFDPQSALTKSGIADAGHLQSISAEGFQGVASDIGLDPKLFAENSVGGKIANWLGSIVNFPMKVLGGTDVVAKNTIYRSAAYARLETEGLKLGIKDPVALAAHVEERLARLTLDGQRYSSKAIIQKGVALAKAAGLTDPDEINKYALNFYNGPSGFDEGLSVLSETLIGEAERGTYTNRPQPGTYNADIQNFVRKHPELRLVAPFINTPMNLLAAAGQRADAISVSRYILGRLNPRLMPELSKTKSRFLQDMLSNDPRRVADAVGRISTGVGAAVFFTSEALAGNITGSGPTDPHQRQALMDTGWQPYSFRIGDSYISYARLDPFATFIGTSADMAEYMNHEADVDDEGAADAVTGLAIGMANNFTNKSYLTGFANLVGAMQAPEKKLPEFFRRQVAAFVPNVLGTAGYGLAQDPNLREVHSLMDALRAKVPGLSKGLPPRRNILGEPLERPRAAGSKDPTVNTLVNVWDPIKYTRVKDDLILQEFAALGHSWEPPKRRTNGVDLMEVPLGNTNAYDRWQELQGTVKIGGMSLRDALRREIKSPVYRNLTPESVDGQVSPRVNRLSRIISDYRSRAWDQMLKEKPALKRHDTAFSANKHRLRAGLPPAIIPGVQ